jgi:hypothetical protein
MQVIKITIMGAEELRGKLRAARPAVREAVAAELFRRAESIMADSKENYVPVDLGILRASGFVEQPQVSDDRISVKLGFGGAAKAYAVIQHERLDFKHRVGGPKYLERPLLAAAAGLRAAIAAAVRRVLKNG